MTEPTPAKPKRAAASKPTAAKPAAPRAAAAKAPAGKAAASKPAAATTASAKTASAKPPVAKSTAGEPAAGKPTTAKAAPKTTARKPAAAKATVPPIVATPAVVAAAASAPAGWYPESSGSPRQRYWDGTAWTEHVHDPAAQAPSAQHVHLRAPEGTNPNTVWIWLTAASPAISIVSYIFLSIFLSQFADLYVNTGTAFSQVDTSPQYITYLLIGLISLAAAIVFPIFDWLALERRGVPKPFHWAWSLFAVALSTPIVYVIGRTVVAKRRTGKGLAPLWLFIALQVITWIVGLVVIIVAIAALATEFGNLLNDSNEVF